MKQEEFEILSKRIRPKLLTVAQKFTLASGVEVDDVVQDALITLWELAEQDYPMQNAEALAIKITKNICVSHYRKARLDTRTSLNDNYTGGTEATVLTDREDLIAIRKSVYASLSKSQREYLHLRNDEGMSLEEIAALTGKPKTSIKSTLSAARRQMLNLIANFL